MMGILCSKAKLLIEECLNIRSIRDILSSIYNMYISEFLYR